jgi:hypothetical protein
MVRAARATSAASPRPGVKVGELRMSRGTIDWQPAKHKYRIQLTWEEFDKVMRETERGSSDSGQPNTFGSVVRPWREVLAAMALAPVVYVLGVETIETASGGG